MDVTFLKIIHIDKLTVYTGTDHIEPSPHGLGFLTQGKRHIPGFQHFLRKGLSRFYKGIDFVWTFSCFYNKITFVASSLYKNHQVSDR